MNVEELLSHFQKYYQLTYEHYERALLEDELSIYTELYLNAASRVLLRKLSKRFHTLPSIAEFHEYEGDILEEHDSMKKDMLESVAQRNSILPKERLSDEYVHDSIAKWCEKLTQKTYYKDGQVTPRYKGGGE